MIEFKSISKSMIHTYNQFVRGDECGYVLKRKYIDRDWKSEWYDSPAMKLGKYFEAVLYNELGFEEPIPEPDYLKSKVEKSKQAGYTPNPDDMMAGYSLATKKAVNVASLMNQSGIKVTMVQRSVERSISANRGGHGILDIDAEYKGRDVMIDIKYSGLIDDKWADMGWAMYRAEQIEYHSIQALHYNMITGKPFYYLVVNSTNADIIKFIKMHITEQDQEMHINRVESISQNMELLQEVDGFINYPNYGKCKACPVSDDCPDAQLILIPKIIETAL